MPRVGLSDKELIAFLASIARSRSETGELHILEDEAIALIDRFDDWIIEARVRLACLELIKQGRLDIDWNGTDDWTFRASEGAAPK